MLLDALRVPGEVDTAAEAVCEGVTVADASGVDPPLQVHVAVFEKTTPVREGILLRRDLMLEGKGAVAVKESDLYTWQLSFSTLFIACFHPFDQHILSSLIVSEKSILQRDLHKHACSALHSSGRKLLRTAEGGRAASLANCVGAQTDILAETTEVLILWHVRALVVALGGDDAVIKSELLLVLIVGGALCPWGGDDAQEQKSYHGTHL